MAAKPPILCKRLLTQSIRRLHRFTTPPLIRRFAGSARLAPASQNLQGNWSSGLTKSVSCTSRVEVANEPSVDSLLRKEHGKALSCYERSLLYARKPPSDLDVLNHDGFPYRYIPTEERQNISAIPQSGDINPLSFITSIYAFAGKMLSERMSQVSDEYTVRRIQVENGGIQVADRDVVFALRSRSAVAQAFENLVIQTKDRADSATLEEGKWHEILESYTDDWDGLNSIARLCMDEITHLSSRVDSFNSSLGTRRSFLLASIALWASSTFAASSLVINIFNRWDPPGARDEEHRELQQSIEDSFNRTEKLKSLLNQIRAPKP